MPHPKWMWIALAWVAACGDAQLQSDNTATEVIAVPVASPVTIANAYQQDPGRDGLVSIEVENYDSSWSWIGETRVDFNVNFVKTGPHYVWLRGLGKAEASARVGIAGATVASSGELAMFGTASSWVHGALEHPVVSFDVMATGIKTVSIWMRPDALMLDKLMITSNAAYVPSGAGASPSAHNSVGVDITLPSTALTAPAPNVTLSGRVEIAATGADDVGVAKLELYIDNVRICSKDRAVAISSSWDTRDATNGPHAIASKAYDAAGNVRTSTVVTVTVDNGVPTSMKAHRASTAI